MTTTAHIIQLPWLRPPLTGNRVRGNPYAQAAKTKAALAEACKAVRGAKLSRIPGANITLHFRPATRHRRDADGMYPTYKVAQDALVIEGVLHDDSFMCVPSATCHIHRPDGTPAAMWLEIQETP